MKYLIYTFFILKTFVINAQYKYNSVDLTHLLLEIEELDTLNKSVKASANYDFKVLDLAVDTIFLRAKNISFSKVELDGKKIKYISNSSQIKIPLPKKFIYSGLHHLKMSYEAIPKKGLYFTGWESKRKDAEKHIWTQGQATNHHHWIPSEEDQTDKMTTEIKLSFNRKYKILSNGELVEKRTKNKETFWHYRIDKPMASYLIMLAIGDFYIKKEVYKSYNYEHSLDSIPFNYWISESKKSNLEATYYGTETIFNILENQIGKYPWKSYSQVPVKDFFFGGMENTTATTFSENYITDSASFPINNYINVNAHEMAHQWFGNSITAKENEDGWIHEGFATFYASKVEGLMFGLENRLWNLYRNKNFIIKNSLENKTPLYHKDAGYLNYVKGDFALHMLEQKIGEKDFKKIINSFYEKNKYGIVDTKMLLDYIDSRTDISVKKFFEQWIYGYEIPEIKISTKNSNKYLTFYFKQKEKPFELDFWINLYGTNNQVINHKVSLSKASDSLNILLPNDFKLSFYTANPLLNVLGNFNYKNKTDNDWENQFLFSNSIIEKLEAYKNIKNKRILLNHLDKNYHPIIWEFVLTNLNGIELSDKESKLLFTKALNHENSKIRLIALSVMDSDEITALRNLVTNLINPKESKFVSGIAFQRICNQKEACLKEISKIEAFETRSNYLNIHKNGFENIYTESEQSFKNLIKYTDSGYTAAERLLAFKYLSQKYNLRESKNTKIMGALDSANRSFDKSLNKFINQFIK